MGTRAFGLVLLQVADGMIQVLDSRKYERPRYQEMADKIMDIMKGLNYRNLLTQDTLDDVKNVDGRTLNL